MVLKLNPELIGYIRNSDFDEDLKQYLIACVILEAQRYKTKYPFFIKDYDNIIERFVK
ncbi:hypothetical protein [Methanobrevibacter curvatus]|jgi:hypothetical protein|uniref:Uncharacterized protein n=1 Tax=Methanobrevibacter curvatus TaxID=49547 RepID=A0A166B3E3_9EURY|nr:hypothetical protein [Methanobrevibacter curvatus]KZX12814.1 hypothetical protein MBCUR_08700 [Methanobrevibacter curvatus]MDR3063520.1 hypothetical protein [Methanobrevibacter sp.]